MDDVSVIIPIYNCEKYLSRCINSLLSQKYKVREICLVNDGSTDGSLSICEKFSRENSNIILISQENKGVSAARNAGLMATHSEYVIFCDADDYVREDYVEKLVQNVKNTDIVACGYVRERGEDRVLYQLSSVDMTMQQFIYYSICTPYVSGACWNKIFRRDLIGTLRFDETLSIGEDMLFLFNYLQKCKKVKYISDACYIYVLNVNSALQENYSNKELGRKVCDNIYAAEKIQQSYCGKDSYIERCISYRTIRSNMWVYFQMVKCTTYVSQYADMIKENLKMNKKNYRLLHAGSLLQDISVILVSVCPKLFFKIANIGVKLFPKMINKYLV